MSGSQSSGIAPLWMERVESYVRLRTSAQRLAVYPLDGTGGRVKALGPNAVSRSPGIFGAAAVSRRRGVMMFDPDAPRAMLQAGRQRILVADSSKLGREALYSFCKLDACDLLITDAGITRQQLSKVQELVKVQVA